ncbi:MAG TPA: efflux RND transporter periplasmic adaptor subunit [Longimicrobiaceae bacterium]|nr:efflux RND transporter periplasmic adaptor subunit [Longimicrobiaceae bacterium]
MTLIETRNRFVAWTKRPLGLVVTIASILLIAFGAFTLFGDRSDAKAEERTGKGEMAGMAGMEGMDMGGMNMSMDGSVHLTADQIRQFGITFGFVEERTLGNEIRTVGIVNFDETRLAQVAPKFSGFVERLYVDFTGKPVRAGQPLVEIYSPELVAAQEEVLLAARLDASLGESSVPGVSAGRSNLAEAAIRRLRLWDISDAQIRQILRTGKVRRTLTLHAPVSGVVIEKPVVRGQAVQAGQSLYTIADLSNVWVEAELRERDAGNVREGSQATVELGSFPGRPLRGTVEYIYPTLESEARTLKARIAIPNPEGRIKPGMYATVRISSPSRTALTVPTSAVVHTGERAVVFVDMGRGKIMPHEVEVGRIAGDQTEILAGVEPGQRVVTSAQYILDSESNMAEVMKSMMGMMGEGMDMGGMEGMDMGGMDMSGGSMQGMEMKGADMKGMKMPRKER